MACFYLKGGDLTTELAPVAETVTRWTLSEVSARTLGLKRSSSCTWRSKKNEGGITAPSETCKDIETDAAF